jgi:hypothetical protein
VLLALVHFVVWKRSAVAREFLATLFHQGVVASFGPGASGIGYPLNRGNGRFARFDAVEELADVTRGGRNGLGRTIRDRLVLLIEDFVPFIVGDDRGVGASRRASSAHSVKRCPEK